MIEELENDEANEAWDNVADVVHTVIAEFKRQLIDDDWFLNMTWPK